MTQLFPPSPLAAAQAFLLSLPAVRFEGLAGLCPAHEPETARSAGEYTVHLCELSLERYMGEADPTEGRGWWTDEEWWGMVQSAQRALNASLKAFIRSASLSRLAGRRVAPEVVDPGPQSCHKVVGRGRVAPRFP